MNHMMDKYRKLEALGVALSIWTVLLVGGNSMPVLLAEVDCCTLKRIYCHDLANDGFVLFYSSTFLLAST